MQAADVRRRPAPSGGSDRSASVAMRSLPFVLIGLLLVLGSVEAKAQPQNPPANPALQAAADQAREALTQGETDALIAASLALHAEVIKLSDLDSRLPPLLNLMARMSAGLRMQLSESELVDFFDELNAVPIDINLPRNVAAWASVNTLAQARISTGDLRGARNLLRDVIAREEPLVGPDFPAIRAARMQLVATISDLGDLGDALDILNGALATTIAIYGQGTPESAEILLNMAQVHGLLGAYRESIGRADGAAYIIRQNLNRLGSLTMLLAELYTNTAQLEKAQEFYRLIEAGLDSADPNVAELRMQLARGQALVNARLGDGESARRDLANAARLAELLREDFPATVFDTMLVEARVYSLAGMFDEAADSITRAETLAEDAAFGEDPRILARLATEALFAMDMRRARELAEQALAGLEDDAGAVYESAVQTQIVAAALSDPPESMLPLARELLARSERENSSSRHLGERFAVALGLAAEGQWEESAAIQKEIVDYEQAEAGPHLTSPIQWSSYAAALERLGRDDERAAVLALLESRRAPLLAALGAQAPRPALVEHRSGFGFELSLGDSHWTPVAGESIGTSVAAFAASYITDDGENHGSIFVVPVLLAAGIGPRTAITGLLDELHADWSSVEPWSDGGLEGYSAMSVDPQAADGTARVYRSRVIVGPDAVYAIITSASESHPEVVAAAAGAIEGVSIVSGATPAGLSPAERELHGRVLLKLVDVHDQLGEHATAISVLDEYVAAFGESADVLIRRAASHAQVGNDEFALRDYGAAFALGLTDDPNAVEYVDLLMRLDRGTEAAAFLDDYAVRSGSLDVHAMQARIAYAIDDPFRLNDALVVLTDPTRSNPDAALAAARIIFDRDGFVGLERLTNVLIEDGLDAPELYLLLAGAEREQGQPEAARRTVEQGLARYPQNVILRGAQ